MNCQSLQLDRQVLDLLPVAVYVCEAATGRIRFYNRRAAELWGIEPGQSGTSGRKCGCGAFSLRTPEGEPIRCDQTPMCSVMRDGMAVHDWEGLVQRPDGSRSNVRVNVEPIRDEQGKIVAAIGTFQEITEHKRTEEALHWSEENFRLLVDGVLDYAIFMLDPEGRVVSWNAGAERTKGYKAEEIIGRHFSCFYTPEDIAAGKPERELEQAAAGGRFEEEGWRIRKDGSRFWASVIMTALYDENGRLRGFAKVTRDITERQRADESMRQAMAQAQEINQELMFQKFALDQHAIVAVTDPKGRITYANDKFCEISKYSQEELLGQDHRIVNSGYHSKAFFKELYATIARGQVWRGDVRNRAKDGTFYWVATTIVPFKDTQGRITRYVVIRADITERKRVEAQLHEAKEAAESANAAKDHFLAVLSHELRTPLTPVVMAAGMLQKDQRLAEDVRQELGMMRRNIELETRLIDDLLDLTRIERGKLELDARPVDAAEALRQAVTICRSEAEATQLRVLSEIEEGPWPVCADPARLQQVFWNLLRNAVKFTSAGGSITVRCRGGSDGRVVMEVSDTGIGIEPDALERVFAAFEQEDRGVTRRFGGLGLGLSISKAIVEQHGGVIRAYSEGRGKGTTFSVELPVLQETAEAGQRTVAESGERHGAMRKLRILLVEDHADSARVLSRVLCAGGHSVETAGSVAAGLKQAMVGGFDLVLSDLGLPDGSGLDLMRQIREKRPLLKGIALSGFGQDSDIEMSRQAGFAEHLIKPVDIGRLEAAVARVAQG